jgi:DNA-binding transcriptional LysR family regulator
MMPPRIGSLASPEAIKNAVAAGMGIAIVSRLIIALELQAGSLGIIPLKDLTIRRPLHLQKVRGQSQSPGLVKFLAMLEPGTRSCAVSFFVGDFVDISGFR